MGFRFITVILIALFVSNAMAEKLKRPRSYVIRYIIDRYFEDNKKWLAVDPLAKKRIG